MVGVEPTTSGVCPYLVLEPVRIVLYGPRCLSLGVAALRAALRASCQAHLSVVQAAHLHFFFIHPYIVPCVNPLASFAVFRAWQGLHSN